MLDQAEIPRRGFDHLLEQFEPVVERETREANLPLLLELHDLVDQLERNHLLFPAAVHDHVDAVEVDDVTPHRPSGFIEKPLEILRFFHNPPRGFGGDVNAVAPLSFERLSGDRLALSAEVDAPGVDVVHPALDRTVDHRNTQI